MHIELLEASSAGYKEPFPTHQKCDTKQAPRYSAGPRSYRKAPKPSSTKLSWEDVQKFLILQSGTLLHLFPTYLSSSYVQALGLLDAYPSLVGFTYPFCFVLALALSIFFVYCLISGTVTLSIALFGWLLMHSFLTTSSFMLVVLPVMTLTFWGCLFTGVSYYLYSLLFGPSPRK